MLRSEYGVQGYVGKALALAYRGCDDTVAWAELFAELVPPDAPPNTRLRLGASWLEAHRAAQALEVLRPLAVEEGPASRAAWLTGYALFELEARAEAGPWLEGARATVEGAKRSDAPAMLALVRLEAGEFEGALRELDDALGLMPDSAPLHAVRAVVLATAGRDVEAEASARTAQELATQEESRRRTALRLEALGEAYEAALRGDDPTVADRLFERRLSEAAPQEQRALLGQRVNVLESAGRERDARRARTRLRSIAAN